MGEALQELWLTYQSVVAFIGINGLLALSVYATLSCGQLSLANAGFMAIGGYAGAPAAPPPPSTSSASASPTASVSETVIQPSIEVAPGITIPLGPPTTIPASPAPGGEGPSPGPSPPP